MFSKFIVAILILATAGSAQNRSQFFQLDQYVSKPAYDSVHKRFLVPATFANEIHVLQLPQRSLVRTIKVPMPSSVALSPDGARIFVSTYVDTIFVIDAVSFEVIDRIVASSSKADFRSIRSDNIAVTSTGKLLYRTEADAGYPSDGYVLYDPATKTYRSIGHASQGQFAFGMAGDGSRAAFASSLDVVFYDAQTDTTQTVFNAGGLGGQPFVSPIGRIAANHNGSRFAIGNDARIDITDGTGNNLATLNISSNGFAFSSDGQFFYVAQESVSRTIQVYETAGWQLVRTAPGLKLFSTRDFLPRPYPIIEIADDSGLVLGRGVLGFSLDDTANPPPLSGQVPMVTASSPRATSQDGGVVASFTGTNIPGAPIELLFGVNPASQILSSSSTQFSGLVPSSSKAGRVDVKARFQTGWFSISPWAFSYGPDVLYVLTSAGTTAGGTTVKLVGLGLDYPISEIQVRFGANPATVLSVNADARNFFPFTTLPGEVDQVPYRLLTVQTPPGSPGIVDVSVQTPAGITTVPRAFQYVGMSSFAHQMNLDGPYYDRFRNVLYVAEPQTGVIHRFDGDSLATLPPLVARVGAFRMVLTHDGERLLVVNSTDKSVSVIDPDTGQSQLVTIFESPAAPILRTRDIALTNRNTAFLTTEQLSGWPRLYEVDLFSLEAREFGTFSVPPSGELESGGDGSTVYLVETGTTSGPVWIWKSEHNGWLRKQIPSPFEGFREGVMVAGDGHLALSATQTLDSQFALRSRLRRPSFFHEADALGIRRQPILNPSGSLAIVPRAASIELLDASSGRLSWRIALPGSIAGGLWSSVATKPDTSAIYVLGSGAIWRVAIPSVPLGVGHAVPAVIENGQESVVTVRGSGFKPGAAVRVNGTSAPTTYIDPDTLSISAPAMNDVTASITVQNPEGDEATGLGILRYVPSAAPPAFTDIEPRQITTIGGPLRAVGSGFTPETRAYWDGVVMSTQFVSTNELLILPPALQNLSRGTHLISLRTPPPGGGNSSQSIPVDVLSHPILINTVFPQSVGAGGPDFNLRVDGITGLTPESKFYWNGIEVPWSGYGSGQTQVTVPAALVSQVGTGLLTASNPSPVLGTNQGVSISVVEPFRFAEFYSGFQIVGSWDVGTVPLFSTRSATFTIRATGNSGLNISSVYATSGFSAVSGCPAIMQVGQTCSVTVTFVASQAGPRTGELHVVANTTNFHPMNLFANVQDITLRASRPSRSLRASMAAERDQEFPLTAGPFSPHQPVDISCSAPRGFSCTVQSVRTQGQGEMRDFRISLSDRRVARLRTAGTALAISLTFSSDGTSRTLVYRP